MHKLANYTFHYRFVNNVLQYIDRTNLCTCKSIKRDFLRSIVLCIHLINSEKLSS